MLELEETEGLSLEADDDGGLKAKILIKIILKS